MTDLQRLQRFRDGVEQPVVGAPAPGQLQPDGHDLTAQGWGDHASVGRSWSTVTSDPYADTTGTSLSRQELDDLVDRVVDRIEQRVVDELERRGRHLTPGAF